MIMTYRNSVGEKKLEKKLDEIYMAVQSLQEGKK